jgi:hypothetical protein
MRAALRRCLTSSPAQIGTSRQTVAGCEVVRHSAELRICSLAPSARNIVVGPRQDIQDICNGRHFTSSQCTYTWSSSQRIAIEYSVKPSRDFERCSPNSLKGVFGRMLRQKKPDLAARYWKGVLWSPSYFAASCGGASMNISLKDYIRQQKTPL